MGILFSIITKRISEVLLLAKLIVWDGLLNFIDYFIQPWRNLFWFCLHVYVCLWSEIGSLTVKILVLPFRIYDAIRKEEAMEIEMRHVQKLLMESKERLRELECEFEQVLDECRQCKELLENIEGEKSAILKKFKVLQLRVIQLEEENDILKEHEERFLKGIYERNIIALQQKKVANAGLNKESHNKDFNMKSCKDEFTQTQPPHTPSKKHMAEKIPLQLDHKHESVPGNVNKCMVDQRAQYKGWEAAIFSSIFSVFLTLLVGTIAWQAQDPCIPLVVAVFMVVCMSLKTVAQFLLSVCNGPGFDAVALLSFNWFILGTLAYPVLPRLAQVVAPIGTKFGHWFLRLVGVTYVTEQLKSSFL